MGELKSNLSKLFESRNEDIIEMNTEVTDGTVNKNGIYTSLYPKQCPYLSMAPNEQELLSKTNSVNGTCIYDNDICDFFEGAQTIMERIFCSVRSNLEAALADQEDMRGVE